MSCEARVEVCPVFGKLPTFGFELEMLGDKGPIERWHPVGNEVVLSDQGLVVVVVGGELDRSEVMNVVVRMPVAQREFR